MVDTLAKQVEKEKMKVMYINYLVINLSYVCIGYLSWQCLVSNKPHLVTCPPTQISIVSHPQTRWGLGIRMGLSISMHTLCVYM